MGYILKNNDEGKTSIYRELYNDKGEKVLINTGLAYKDAEKARKISWALDMVSSVFAYNGVDMNNRYIQKYLDEGVCRKTLEKEFEWLAHNTDTRYAGEDSEGVWYNAIVYSPNKK